MPVAVKMKTNGQLRQMMADMAVEVRAGTADIEAGTVVSKLASQITENLYAELKARGVLDIKSGQALGTLPIGDASQEDQED